MIKEFEKDYFIDEEGNVYKKLKPYQNSQYMYIKANGKHYAIHRIVGEHFLSNPKNLNIINHKDGNKNNNNVANLEWCTQQENVQHYLKNGGTAIKRFIPCYLYKGDELIKECGSILEACKESEKYGCKFSMMNKWKNHNGYKIVKG